MKFPIASILIFCLALFLAPSLLLAQQPAATTAQQKKLPQAIRPLSPSICGKGNLLLLLGAQSLGHEAFEITCRDDGGYAGSGRTEMKLPGVTIDITTTIATDREANPSRFTAKGTLGPNTLDQSITVVNDKATIIDKGQSQEVAYPKGTAFLVMNVNYLYQFILARYDVARGGAQQLNVFPNLQVTMEHTARDEVRPGAMTAAAVKPLFFDRYRLQLPGAPELALWTDAQGRLALFSVPAQSFVAVREEYGSFVEPLRAALTATVKELVPDYSAPADAPYRAEEVSIQVKGFKLGGTLLLPKNGKGPFPAVVTSTGSGQQTRDENIALPGLEKYRPFRQIAERLASRGIAVLRVDDRGVGASTGLETLNTATTFDFADDVRAQVAYLRSRPEIDPERIAIIGHSEGGAIGPLVASTDGRLAAVVIMAGPARRGDEVLSYQLDYPYAHDPKLSTEELEKKRAENRAFIRAVMEKDDVSKYPAALQALNVDWTRAFLTYDPLPTIRKVRQPILILQGALDRQVTADQAEMLAEAARKAGNRDVTVRLFPNLGHLFLPSATGAGSEYTRLEADALSDEVLQVITDWLEVKLKTKK